MKLESLSLQNFQGVKALAIKADGKDVTVRGDNGTGKTTVANAICWLLFGKPSTEETGYTPKTIDKNGEELHGLEHTAEGVFILDDGSKLRLTKTYKEVWTKKKGVATETFSGHVTDHYIDGVPFGSKAYQTRLEEICDAEKTRMLTTPAYFADVLDWKKRREILLEVCGNVEDEDVINSSENLKPIREYLVKPGTTDQYYTVEEYSAIAKAQKTKLNNDIQLIPTRIDEAKRAINKNKDGITDNEANRGIADLKKEIETYDGERRAIESGTNTAEFTTQIAELKAKIAEGRAKHAEAESECNQEAVRTAGELKMAIAEKTSNKHLAESQLKTEQTGILKVQAERIKLIDRYKTVQAEQPTIETECPTCGQALQEEKVEEAKARFNLHKSEKLAEINATGTLCSKDVISKSEQKTTEIELSISNLEAEINALTEQLRQVQESIVLTRYEDSEEYASLATQISTINAKQAEEGKDTTEEINAIQSKISELKEIINEFENVKIQNAVAIVQEKRIAELMETEKEMAAAYEKIEYGVWLCEEFTRIKSSMLTEKINGAFRTVNFQLFKTQINGGQDECCTTLVTTGEGLKPWAKANTGATIIAGIEIADTLARHWGITMPLIIDNCEAVTDTTMAQLGPVISQQIKMYADDKPAGLTIEV